MSTISSRRLNFVLKERTQSWVALQTGYSQSSISKWSRGITTVPTGVYKSIRNTFQREAYNRLRRVGAPGHQARRFSSFAPKSVTSFSESYNKMADVFTKGASAKYADKYDIKISVVSTPEYQFEIKESVLKGMQKSYKTWEEWNDYLKERFGVTW